MWHKNNSVIEKCFENDITIACVYHQYETNYKGDYTVSLCREDQTSGTLNTNLYSWKTYSVDTKDKMGVIKTWQRIWEEEDNKKINRVYDFDFEQYKSNGEVTIFVAVK